MTSAVARLAWERGRRWLESGRRALTDRRWDDAVYAAQMASEQAAKGLLLAAGIEVPKQHDVSNLLLDLGMEPGRSFARDELEEVARIVADLASRRALAAYGFESEVGVEEFRAVAPRAVREAARVVGFVRAALGLAGRAGPRARPSHRGRSR